MRRDTTLVEEALNLLFVLWFEQDNTNDLAVGRVNIRLDGIVIVLRLLRIGNFNPLRLFDRDTENTCSLLEI